MELKNIEAFLMVIEKGSFSIAAQALYITQPTISSRILRLEDELSVSLFDREGGRKASPTPAGNILYPYLKTGYQSIQKGALKVRSQVPDNVIRLSFPYHIGQYILPAVHSILHQEFPNVEFPLKINVVSKIMDDLLQLETDVGLVYLNDDHQLDKENFTFVHVTDDPLIPVASPTHPITQNKQVSVMDLQDEQLIIYTRTFSANIIIDKFLTGHGLSEYRTMEIKDFMSIKNAVGNGQGISFLQHHIVKDELKNNTLVALHMDQKLPTVPVSLIFKETLPKEFKQVLLSTIKNLFNTL